MKFCPECGCKTEGMKFCPECGYKIMDNTESRTQNPEPQANTTGSGLGTPEEDHVVLSNEEAVVLNFSTYLMLGANLEKKNLIGGLDISMPKEDYTLTTERLIIKKTGLLKQGYDEIELYKVEDVSVKQTLTGKALGTGDITITPTESNVPKVVLKSIKEPAKIANLITATVRDSKKNLNKSLNIVYRKDI